MGRFGSPPTKKSPKQTQQADAFAKPQAFVLIANHKGPTSVHGPHPQKNSGCTHRQNYPGAPNMGPPYGKLPILFPYF